MFRRTDYHVCSEPILNSVRWASALCTIGLGTSIYHYRRRTAFHVSYETWRSADFHSQRSDGRIVDRLARLQTAVEAQQ
jgi:hypothetical protein